MQRKNRCQDISLEEVTIESAYLEPGFENIQSDMVLKQLVKNLPTDLQEIVILRFGQDLTLREKAQAVDMQLQTVQSRLRSALKKIKKEIEEGGLL